MTLPRQAGKALFAGLDLLLPRPRGSRILIFHRVGEFDGKQMEVKEDDFRWQIQWLSRNRKVVDLETAIENWADENADQYVALTFDDGFRDTYETVFPIMLEAGMPFTLYLTTSRVASNRGEDGLLTWAEVTEMRDSGLVTIGSHTHTHRDLRRATVDEIEWEVATSDELIAENVGDQPLHFTYPWGHWSQRAHTKVVQRYDSATVGGVLRRADFDRHIVPRFPVQLSDGRRWFGRRLRGGLRAEEVVRRLLNGYRGP